MKFAFEPDVRLPPLAWCASVRSGCVLVRHGAGVETRDCGFVEGAWNGDFDAFDLDTAEMLCGSGARIREGAAVFAAPSHPLERLFAMTRRDDVLVSNSLVFLLTEADDGLDPAHPGYFFDFLERSRRGIAPPVTELPTRNNQRVLLFPCCNVRIGADLRPVHEPKPIGQAPRSYADLFRLLLETTSAVANNAQAGGRTETYRMVAACSRGYDSTAAASIASRAGCREGVTFVQNMARSGHPLTGLHEWPEDDSGADSLRSLGLQVHEFDRREITRLGGLRAECFINTPPTITDATMAVMAGTLRGSLFVSGRHAERYWGPTRRCARLDFREVDDCTLAGHGLGELRLRVGFLHLPLPYIGARHGPALYRITHLREMDPWRLGTGYYDRPIARRIAEEAGVPRENFGHHKMGAGAGTLRPLDAESQADFDAFVAAEVPARIRRRLESRPRPSRTTDHRRLAYFRTHYAHLPAVDPLIRLTGLERLHLLYKSIHQYQFHWGVARTRERYRSVAKSL